MPFVPANLSPVFLACPTCSPSRQPLQTVSIAQAQPCCCCIGTTAAGYYQRLICSMNIAERDSGRLIAPKIFGMRQCRQ